MKVKKFIVYALVYVVLMSVLVFTINGKMYSAEFLGKTFEFPIALWVMLPTVIFALLCILHISYYSFHLYMSGRSVRHDTAIFDNLTKEILLAQDSNKDFKSEFFTTAAAVVKSMSPWKEFSKPNFKNEELRRVAEIVVNVKNGEVEDIKRFKLAKDNPLFIQNELNKLAKEPKYALEILKNRAQLGDVISKAAFETLIKTGSHLEIKKFSFAKTKEHIATIVSRYANEEGFEMAKDELFSIINSVDFSEREYIEFVNELSKKIPPQSLMGMFEKLKNTHPDAGEAYLYVLYELGMTDLLREQLAVADGDESEIFKALLILKENGKNFPAQLFFK